MIRKKLKNYKIVEKIKKPVKEIYKMSFRQRCALFCTSFFVVLTLLVFLFSSVHYKASVLIPYGSSVSSVAAKLKDSNLILSEYMFKGLVYALGGKIKAGYYDINKGATMFSIASNMVEGKISMASVVVPEGMTAKQIRHILYRNPDLSGEITEEMIDGELFPSTYHVSKGEDRNNVIKLMKKEMQDIRQKYWDDLNHQGHLKTWDEVVNLASIIEKETMLDSEKSIVASVYINRLKQNMKLQADPTVIYSVSDKLGSMHGEKLLKSHLTTDSKYNTYKYRGLPPTAIANPGLQSILAAIQPAETNYLFFVADGKGGHIFSENLAEHQKNHNNWRKIRSETNWKTEEKTKQN